MAKPRSWAIGTSAAAAVLALAACQAPPPRVEEPAPPAPSPARIPSPPAAGAVVGQSDKFVLYAPGPNETLAAIARRFLGSDERAWEIAKFNGIARPEVGRIVAVPLQPINPTGVYANGFQKVPILCYHRFGPKSSKMVVTPDAFAAQLDYLARNGYRVVSLSQLVDFLAGKRGLPERALVITIDDGHVSAYEHAYPLLKKYGFPATFFVYADFIGSGEALRWHQIKEMAASGLIDFQAHSKTHANLVERLPGESDQRYRERLDSEIRFPQELLQRNLATGVTQYAYPYGDANEVVLARLGAAEFQLGVTVNPGGNPFFAQPLMLRRTMVFGDYDMEAFKPLLQVFKPADLR
ncbi:MAG TPA: polysaccharide deacetylase family protein [Burkholderiales bacterium]|nr:polysaccharide deacetylase family protein [Burkholderiales bacterium]